MFSFASLKAGMTDKHRKIDTLIALFIFSRQTAMRARGRAKESLVINVLFNADARCSILLG